MTHSRKVDVTIDGKKITSNGKKIELKIDGVRVYSTAHPSDTDKAEIKDLQWSSIRYLLKASDSAFSHEDRFRIVKCLVESSMSFTEIKKLLDTTSATANFHLKKLIAGMIAYKNENGRYALTLLGELVLDYFSKFLEEASLLEETMNQ